MTTYPVFISVVCVVHQQSHQIKQMVKEVADKVSTLVSDYELIIIDNGSDDESIKLLKELTLENGEPNIQVYALTKQVDVDTASWVGVENALGDFVVIINPMLDDIAFLPDMLDKAVAGNDIVLAKNNVKSRHSFLYKCANSIFNRMYKWFNGVHLSNEAPQYRILSKSVVNFILQHSQPSLIYRHIPITGGFTRANLEYTFPPKMAVTKSFWDSTDRGMRMLISTTKAPMRIVTTLTIFGAMANLFYSVYVISIYIMKSDIAAGWVSLSLQQSGMFFLLSMVLFVLGEYILHMASMSNEGPLYHVAQEFTSARMTRNEKLNIEIVSKNKVNEVIN